MKRREDGRDERGGDGRRPRAPVTLTGAGLFALLAWASSPVDAAPEAVASAAPVAPAANRVGVVVGLASPWGEAGVSYQRALHPLFAFEIGVGAGLMGFHFVALPKVSLGSEAAHLFVDAGPSVTVKDAVGTWIAGELGFESTSGPWTRSFSAGAIILAKGSLVAPICLDQCRMLGPGFWLPEIRVNVGYNF